MLSNLLVYRLLLINLMGIVLLAYAYIEGWVSVVIEGDSTGLVYAMAVLFVAFMVSLSVRAGRVSAQLNAVKRGLKPKPINGAKFLEKMAHLDEIPGWLVVLGLLGTVIGIMISLSGIDQETLLGVDGVKTAVEQLMQGMRVAFCTTIAGSVLGLWCDINRRILKTATVLMLEDQPS